MKSFEEAFAMVAPSVEIAKLTPEIDAQMRARVSADMDRVEDIVRGGLSDPRLQVLLKAVADDSCCVQHMLEGAFQLGLRIGMAMEQSETGGVLVE